MLIVEIFQRYGDYGDREVAGGEMESKIDSVSPQKNANPLPKSSQQSALQSEWPLWEVFIRSKQGLDHKHAGSLHAADAKMAIANARDVYTRRMEGVSIWVVESKYIHASNPDEADSFYEPANDKVYRHPTFYELPEQVQYM
jgi:ring-1,2-phenylacetyl-CoA epoxidase subunit PaaB